MLHLPHPLFVFIYFVFMMEINLIMIMIMIMISLVVTNKFVFDRRHIVTTIRRHLLCLYIRYREQLFLIKRDKVSLNNFCVHLYVISIKLRNLRNQLQFSDQDGRVYKLRFSVFPAYICILRPSISSRIYSTQLPSWKLGMQDVWNYWNGL